MAIKAKVEITGDGGLLLGKLDWLDRKSKKAFRRTLRTEAKFLAMEMKKELRTGGNPKFAPLSPFTIAIRRAQGIGSRRPGISEGNVLRAIKSTKVSDLSFFSGVSGGTKVNGLRGSVDVFKAAESLELGKKPIILDLDKPSKRTGKTPRQWLWWLYLNGALENPPNKAKTHLLLNGSPPRPFAGNVFKREEKGTVGRISKTLQKIASAEIKPKKFGKV